METADDAEVKTGIGAEEVVLATEEIDDGAIFGSDADTEDDMLVISGATEDVNADADADPGMERLKAVVLLSTFSTEAEATVALEEVAEAAFVLTASAFVDVVEVELMSICKARVAFMIAFP